MLNKLTELLERDEPLFKSLLDDCREDYYYIMRVTKVLGFVYEVRTQNSNTAIPLFKPVDFTDEEIKAQKAAMASALFKKYDSQFLFEGVWTASTTVNKFFMMLKRAHERAYNNTYDYYPEKNEYRHQSHRKMAGFGIFEYKPLPKNDSKFPLFLIKVSTYKDNTRVIDIFRLKTTITKKRLFNHQKLLIHNRVKSLW